MCLKPQVFLFVFFYYLLTITYRLPARQATSTTTTPSLPPLPPLGQDSSRLYHHHFDERPPLSSPTPGTTTKESEGLETCCRHLSSPSQQVRFLSFSSLFSLLTNVFTSTTYMTTPGHSTTSAHHSTTPPRHSTSLNHLITSLNHYLAVARWCPNNDFII